MGSARHTSLQQQQRLAFCKMLLTWTACKLLTALLTALPGAECLRSAAIYEHAARYRREWASHCLDAGCMSGMLGCSSSFLGLLVVCASAMPMTHNMLSKALQQSSDGIRCQRHSMHDVWPS